MPLEVLRHPRDGRLYVAADSLVDLFEDMASKGEPDLPMTRTYHKLADTFRGMSTYDDLPASDDGGAVVARSCACGSPVIDAVAVGGATVVVDADLDRNGDWIVLRVHEGKVTVSPWGPHLDGSDPSRLATHSCGAGQ